MTKFPPGTFVAVFGMSKRFSYEFGTVLKCAGLKPLRIYGTRQVVCRIIGSDERISRIAAVKDIQQARLTHYGPVVTESDVSS